MNRWTGEQRAFAIKAYYKNNDSFIPAQKAFSTPLQYPSQ